MINRHPSSATKPQPCVITSFGRSLLVRVAPSLYELHGASSEDLTAAKEWVSMFLHDGLLSHRPPGGRPLPK